MTKGKGCRGTETPQWNMEEWAKVKERNGRERAVREGEEWREGEEGEIRRMTREKWRKWKAGENSCNEPSLCAAGMCERQSR